MRKVVVILVLVVAVAGGAWYYRSNESDAAAAGPPGQPGAGGFGGRGGGAPGGRQPMTVDTATVSRHEIIEYVTVVGNLIGAATVDVVPRVAGRIESINVQLGDRVTKGQAVAKIEDRQIRSQITQSEATLKVNDANVVQRENDEKLAAGVLERTKLTYANGLASKQALEDAESRYNLTVSQVTSAKAQVAQTQARIEELKITLSDTNVISPVDGFVGRRALDQGAFAGANTVLLSVVDLSTVRMVASLVEKDFKRIRPGVAARVEVDAFPGEKFSGEVSRVAPIFDPATRTAMMEIEVPNPGFRLKPGLYARVQLTVDRKPNTPSLPRDAIVNIDGKHGVYVVDGQVARFRDVVTGIQDDQWVEVVEGLGDKDRVVTVGALALRDGDRVTLVGETPPEGRSGGRGRGGRAGQGGRE